MSDRDPPVTRLRVADLPPRGETSFDLRPDAAARERLADALGLLGLRKLRLDGTVTPEGRHGWRLEAALGATVVQPCVVTLAPVTTRLDEPVIRRFLPEEMIPLAPEGGEAETAEDETVEPLGAVIYLSAVLAEALALALPVWPRAEGAELGAVQTAPPGAAPLEEDGAPQPFAQLAALRDRMAAGAADEPDGEGPGNGNLDDGARKDVGGRGGRDGGGPEEP